MNGNPNPRLTMYAVHKRGRIVASGNLQQCWTYVFNTNDIKKSPETLAEEGVSIQPAKRGKRA